MFFATEQLDITSLMTAAVETLSDLNTADPRLKQTEPIFLQFRVFI